MQSLLRWSIENSSSGQNAGAQAQLSTGERKPLDPGVIDMLLGKSDAEMMKENMQTATDASRTEDDRVDALDNLEMLVEQIDNATDLEKLKLWEPLQSLITSEKSSLPIKTQALWVAGTAVQNNPKAQDAYMALNPLPALMSFLIPSPSSTLQTRSKAMYAISGLLKHNAPAVREMSNPNVDGWPRLREALQDPQITVRRKTLFLLGALILPTINTSASSSSAPPNVHLPSAASPAQPSQPVYDNTHAAQIKDPSRTVTCNLTVAAIQEHGILDAIVSGLVEPLPYGEDGDETDPDATFEEHGVRFLHTYLVLNKGRIDPKSKDTLRVWIAQEQQREGDQALADRWSLGLDELKQLTSSIA